MADENLNPALVEWLRDSGFDVSTVSGSNLAGALDAAILAAATAAGGVVLTHDSDFRQLAVASRQSFIGIVYLRPGHIGTAPTIATLEAVLSIAELAAPFIVVAKWTEEGVRLRLRSLS